MMNQPPRLSEEPAVAPELTDEQLMQAIIDREQSALNRLYARYRPLICKIVVEILPNEADAEEALQDVFMEIWTRAANYDVKKGKPLGWIICMARRRAIDHYRKIRRRAEASEKLRLEAGETSLGTEDHATIAGCTAETPVTTDLRRFLMKIIGSLPLEQERVIHLSYFKDMSQREIAARTGIPLGTIKTRLDLALRKLTQKSMQYRDELYVS
jgi:RNA polymerase sigma-70 factor (ECF subfamily)